MVSAPAISVETLIMGKPLSGLGRRARLKADPVAEAAYLKMVTQRLGSSGMRSARSFMGNVGTKPQSVVKRIVRGGTRDALQLTRQINYITRENTVKSWASLNGMGVTELSEEDVPRTVSHWTSGWRGNPKHGHTDHILLSFPKGTDPVVAQEIAEDWGEEMFGEGAFGDTWQYVAAFHKEEDKDHPHAHFIVNKLGFFEREWLSISNRGHLDFDTMREFHAEIASRHGVELTASSRLSRGITKPGPDQSDYRDAMREGRVVAPKVFSAARQARMREDVAVFIKSYEALASSAVKAGKQALSNDAYSQDEASSVQSDLYNLAEVLLSASNTLKEGNVILPNTQVSQNAADTTINEYMASRTHMEERIDQTYQNIQDMDEGAGKQEALGLLVNTISNAESELSKMFPDHPVIRAYTDEVEGQDAYKSMIMGKAAELKENGHDAIAVRAVENCLGYLREKLAEEVSNTEGDTSSMIEHMLDGGAKSQGQYDDWKRADIASFVETKGENLDTAPQSLMDKAEAWFEKTSAQLREAIDTDREIIPVGLMANIAAGSLQDGADVGEASENYPALNGFIKNLSDPDKEKILYGNLSSLAEHTGDKAAQNALAAEVAHASEADQTERAGQFKDETLAQLNLRERQSELSRDEDVAEL